MNAQRPHLLIALFAVLSFGAMGCTIAATPHSLSYAGPAVAVQSTRVVHTAPARVYHSGQWLHYRSDGYYYRSGSTWVVASSVPTHVGHYHRPVHYRTTTPTHYRTSGPTHVRTSGPTHVRTSRPVHVQRTTSNRRTYYRR